MKKGLLIIAAVLMLASVAQSGNIKLEKWPCTFVAQPLFTIPVYMNVGYFIYVKDQNKKINLTQDTATHTTYTGCVSFLVQSNFNATLGCTVAKYTPAAGEQTAWEGNDTKATCTLDVTNIVALTATPVKVCVTIQKLNMALVTAGTNNVHVADVTITVIPTAGYPAEVPVPPQA